MVYRVSGKRIQHNGINIRLFGVNVIGAELMQPVIGGLWAGLTIKQYLTAVKGQKFNCLRIPIGPRCLSNMVPDQTLLATWMTENQYLAGMGALQIMDEWIKECELLGIRYIFDIHYLRPSNGTIPDLWYDGDYTETDWLNNMKQIATRYKGNPGFVGIDTKNEPNWNTCTYGDGNPATDWKLASEKAFNAINSVNQDILYIMEPLGLEGGMDQIANNPPSNVPRDRFVLSPHIYGPDVWWPFGQGFSDPNFAAHSVMYPVWDFIFGNVANNWCVLVGEWGGKYGQGHPKDVQWQDTFSDYLRDKGILDFTYWGWGENSGHDTGGILADGGYRNIRTDKMQMLNKLHNSDAKFTQQTVQSGGGGGGGGTTPPPTSPVTATEYRVSGRRMFHNGNRIQLFGVNVVGAELQMPVIGGLWSSISIQEFLAKVKSTGFNCLRIPIGPKCIQGVNVDQNFTASGWYSPNAYLASMNSLQLMDEWIKRCEEIGMRYIFDIHQLRDNGTIPDLWYDGSYTEQNWLQNIQFLATRYKGKPGFVGIDLKNEPSDNTCTWGDGNTATDWRLAVNKAYTAINAVNTDILVIVSSIKHTGGFDQILANPPTIPANRLVLTVHIYGPDVWNPNGSDTLDPSFPSNMAAIWDNMVGDALIDKCIYLGEFGGEFGEDHPKDDDWQIAFVNWLISREIDDFTYWAWGPNSADTKGILRDDWRTVHQSKMDNLLRMKNVYATFSNQTSTPVEIEEPPPVVPVLPTKYRARFNRILHNGHDIQLFGVNVIGAELPENAISGLWSSITIKQYLTAIKALKFNSLRIPIGPRVLAGAEVPGWAIADWMPENAYLVGKNALELMDEWIKEAELLGLRYIFDMHYLDSNGNIPDLWYTDDYPESTWLANMVALATRYKGNPGFVGIDLKNEPSANTATWGSGDLDTDWRLACHRAYNAINAVNTDILIFIEWLGTTQGLQQLTGNPPSIPQDRYVLSPHIYGPDVWWPFGEGFDSPTFPLNMPVIWERMFGLTSQTVPVWIGEFGGEYGRDHPLDDDWQNALVEYMKNRKIIHFAYWAWGPNSADTGGILEDDWRTPRADKIAMLNNIYTSQAKFSNQTMTVITPIDPPPPGNPGNPGNPGTPTDPGTGGGGGGTPTDPNTPTWPGWPGGGAETGGDGIDPDYPFDAQYPVKPLTRKKVGVDYRALLIKLFPRGRAWKIEHDTVTSQLMDAFGVELQRVDFAVDRLLTEADPRTTIDNLVEWEKEFGLPDECATLASNFADRRVALVRKILATGGQSEAYFRSLGPSASDMHVTVGVPTTLPMEVLGPVKGLAFKFIWFVDLSDAQYKWASAGDPAGVPINEKVDSGNIVCLLQKYKPAHTHIVFI